MDKKQMNDRKRVRGYIVLPIFIVAMVNVLLLHGLFLKKDFHQIQSESKLPYGNYLPDSKNPLIRVVIKTNGFLQIAHPEVEICVDNTVMKIKPDDERFQKGSIIITPSYKERKIQICSLKRGYGAPSYGGIIELFSTAEGIIIVNELPVEEYLLAVVPSEMPSSYHKEALKCQAICARSYAYCQMLRFAYPEYEAHVDDSVAFQVYGNSKEQSATNEAVQETAGKKLWYNQEVVKTYYYSTSCGHSTSVEAWGSKITEKNSYLQGVAICDEQGNDYERKLPWYKWKVSIHQISLENRIEGNLGQEIGTLENITVSKRGKGGIVQSLTIYGTKEQLVVETENKIRSLFSGDTYTIEKQDGNMVNSTNLLPSAFFSIAKIGENYIIEGGGYGHGIGLSQNGANEMAKTGMNYEDILTFFYPGTKVKI